MPYKDFMNIHERSVPIKMYDGIADFHGMLTLSPQRLIGKGNAEFFKANLESNKMVFQERMFDADTCNFNLKNGKRTQVKVQEASPNCTRPAPI
jgi:ubiquinone/menaquinone biosynthesis C-methylase UbiE